MHRHPNADEWQYDVRGEARMTVFDTGPKARTADFRPGDVKNSLGHHIENTGRTEPQFLEVFKALRYEEVSPSDWLTHTPAGLVAQHLNIDPAVVARFPSNRPDVLPA